MSLKDWKPCDRPGEWPLVGRLITLEPLDWSVHGISLYAAVAGENSQDIWKYMPIGPYTDFDHFQSLFGGVADLRDWSTLVFRDSSIREITGMSSYMRLRPEHGSVEIGAVAFSYDLQRTAAATEAMYLMASHVFDELGYRRYEWKCHNKNKASHRAAERLGFKFEGIFRNDMVVRGKNRDTAWYAMTDEDWPKLKRAFEQWLDPDNFDAAGQQKTRLEDFR